MGLIYNYNERGYYHAKSALSKEFCKVLLNKINELPPKVFLPFSGTPWGYGQLFDVKPFDKILTNPILTKFCESLYNTKDYKVNHLLVSNKVAWTGPEEIYHHRHMLFLIPMILLFAYDQYDSILYLHAQVYPTYGILE